MTASSRIASISSSVSCAKRLIETMTGMLVSARFLTCRRRFDAAPALVASTFSVSSSSGVGLRPPPEAKPPPCIFMARTVALSIRQSGTTPDAGALMWNAFSAPISAPKPASVMT